LLTRVDADAFEYGEISSEKWHLAKAMSEARDRYYRWTLGQSELERQYEVDVDEWEDDNRVLSWLVASMPFDYVSFKKLKRIVRCIYDRLRTEELPKMVEGHLALIKSVLRDKVVGFIQEQVDKQTEAAFRQLYDQGRLVFYLECAECRFQIPETITINQPAGSFIVTGNRFRNRCSIMSRMKLTTSTSARRPSLSIETKTSCGGIEI
jgi:hypothetical protein